MATHHSRLRARTVQLLIIGAVATDPCLAQTGLDSVSIRLQRASGSVYMAEGVNGFGGGNVAVSVGADGVLLVDDMYKAMVPKLQKAIASVSPQPVRIVINTHFHGDHIQGNSALGASATIIAHENVLKRVSAAISPAAMPYPMVTFRDAIAVRFNGETVRIQHVPPSHTEGDAIVFFEASKVLHLGDLFFAGMFPAVYSEGGGDIKGLTASIERILAEFPADTKVIPGHGELSTMTDLRDYATMLEETVAAVERGIREKKTAAELQNDPAIRKYAKLGDGGARTLEQYVAMLLKLLQ